MINTIFESIKNDMDCISDRATKAYLIRGIVSSINGSAIGLAISYCRQTDKLSKTIDERNTLDIKLSDDPGIPEFGPQNQDPRVTIRSLMFLKEVLLDMGNFPDEIRNQIDTAAATLDYMINNQTNMDQLEAMVESLGLNPEQINAAAVEAQEANKQYLSYNKNRILDILEDYEYDYEIEVEQVWKNIPSKTKAKILCSMKRGFDKAVNNCLKAAFQFNRTERLLEIPIFKAMGSSVDKAIDTLDVDAQMLIYNL